MAQPTPSARSNSRLAKKGKGRSNRESMHFGTERFELGMEEELIGDATWLEVYESCCVHSLQGWLISILGLVLILGCLYFFGLGLEFLGSGAKIMSACSTGDLFAETFNPVAGVMIGVLLTVLLQSSSTTTSIVVGLVGAANSTITVQQGIYMIMGANIGTTVTNTIVSLGHFRSAEQLELAFAGATVHDMFNYLTVAILLPLEVATNYLHRLTAKMVRGADTENGDTWQGPAKRFITPLADKVIIANKKVANFVVAGGSCEKFYPINCTDPEHPTTSSCSVALIACDKHTGKCPAFFDPYANNAEEQVAGLVAFVIGLFVIFASLQALVVVITGLLRGVSVRVIYKATNLDGYVLIAIGCGLTIMLQSSSTTTSFLTPLVGMGALRLEQMYPMTIGANLGTTVSALFAAMATDGNEALQVALAHLMFNVTGMMIWYPIPPVRMIPVTFARRLGQYARVWRSFTLFYLLFMFVLIPALFLGLSTMFIQGTTEVVVFASILTAVLAVVLAFGIRWCYFKGGRTLFYKYLATKRDRYYALLTLTTDMERAKRQIRQHMEYAGVAVDPVEAELAERKDLRATPRQIERARLHVADDMRFVKEAISMLYFHTGLPESYEPVDGDKERNTADEESDSSSDGIHDGKEQGKPKTPHLQREPEKTLFQETTWQVLCTAVVVFALYIWGAVALFNAGSVGKRGAASFMLILLGIFAVTLGYELSTETGRRAATMFFRNHRKRSVSIKRLPINMRFAKQNLKELLAHYKLSLEDGPSSNDTSSFEVASSSGYAESSYRV